MPFTVEALSPNHWPNREVLKLLILKEWLESALIYNVQEMWIFFLGIYNIALLQGAGEASLMVPNDVCEISWYLLRN